MDIASHAAFDLQLFVSTSVFGRLLQQMDRWGNYTEAQAARAAKVRIPSYSFPQPIRSTTLPNPGSARRNSRFCCAKKFLALIRCALW